MQAPPTQVFSGLDPGFPRYVEIRTPHTMAETTHLGKTARVSIRRDRSEAGGRAGRAIPRPDAALPRGPTLGRGLQTAAAAQRPLHSAVCADAARRNPLRAPVLAATAR